MQVPTLEVRLTGQPRIPESREVERSSVWFLVGNGGMDYGDYYWGFYRDYYRDPFSHSLLSARQAIVAFGRNYLKSR